MFNETKVKNTAARLCHSLIFLMLATLDTQTLEFCPIEQNPLSLGHLELNHTKNSWYLIESIFWFYAVFPLFLSNEVPFWTNFKINSFKASFYIIIACREHDIF